MAEPLLAVTNLETFYGPIMAIRGVSFARAARGHRHHPGRQRRGQDDDPQDRVRRDGSAEGHRDASTAARSRAWIPTGSRGSGSATCRRAARSFRSSPCARTSRWAPTPGPTPTAWPATWRWSTSTSRCSKSRAEQRAGLALGWRAADAVDQPGADGAARR